MAAQYHFANQEHWKTGIIDFTAPMDRQNLHYLMGHRNNPTYLSRYCENNLPLRPLLSYALGESTILRDAYSSEDVKALLSLADELEMNPAKSLEKRIKSLLWASRDLQPIGDGDATEPLPKDLMAKLALCYVPLPHDLVRLHALDGERDRGYFTCFGWNPLRNELYFFGFDFIINRTPEEAVERKSRVPLGRGLPDDIVLTAANCGPAALAAYLNTSTQHIIKHSYDYRERGWISIVPMLELIGKPDFGLPHQSIKLGREETLPSRAFGSSPAGLAFIQYIGQKPGGKYSGWSSWSQAYANTHWIAVDSGKVYDVNAIHADGTPGDWIDELRWSDELIPIIIPANSGSYIIRNILIPA